MMQLILNMLEIPRIVKINAKGRNYVIIGPLRHMRVYVFFMTNMLLVMKHNHVGLIMVVGEDQEFVDKVNRQ